MTQNVAEGNFHLRLGNKAINEQPESKTNVHVLAKGNFHLRPGNKAINEQPKSQNELPIVRRRQFPPEAG